jgi:hypothetical protein
MNNPETPAILATRHRTVAKMNFGAVLSERLSYGRLCKSVTTSMDTNCSMKVQKANNMIFFLD